MRHNQQNSEMFDSEILRKAEEDEPFRADNAIQYERLTHQMQSETDFEKIKEIDTQIRDLLSIGLYRSDQCVMVRLLSVKRAEGYEVGGEYVVELVTVTRTERVSMPALAFLRTHTYFAREYA